MSYTIKNCYDCGIRRSADQMEKVTESYSSGQSNTTVTLGNLAWGAIGDKRGQDAVGRAFKENNRRSYTRNRTVWKCMECSGTNDHHRAMVLKDISVAKTAVNSARKGSLFSKAKVISPEIDARLKSIEDLRGTPKSKTSEDLLLEIQTLLYGGKNPVRPPMNLGKKFALWTCIVFGGLILLGTVLQLVEGSFVFSLELLVTVFLGALLVFKPLDVMFFRPNRLAEKEC